MENFLSFGSKEALATALGATVLKPYYPASDLFRVVRDDDGLQLDYSFRGSAL